MCLRRQTTLKSVTLRRNPSHPPNSTAEPEPGNDEVAALPFRARKARRVRSARLGQQVVQRLLGGRHHLVSCLVCRWGGPKFFFFFFFRFLKRFEKGGTAVCRCCIG